MALAPRLSPAAVGAVVGALGGAFVSTACGSATGTRCSFAEFWQPLAPSAAASSQQRSPPRQ
ncbi:MAG TPA: hypothetical protein VFS67_36380 [Polyangiaceae bacterium]|nr:hypothetical protein [Polyangiaceae bacterium]